MSKIGKDTSILRKIRTVFLEYLTNKIHTGHNVWDARCIPIGTAAMSGTSRKEEKYGLIQGKPYIILDGKDFWSKRRTHKWKETERLLRLRNPWGPREWKCEWGDNS